MLLKKKKRMAYVGLRVGGVPDVQLAEGQERDLSRKVHLIELHQNFSAHLVRLDDVVKQPDARKTHDSEQFLTDYTSLGHSLQMNLYTCARQIITIVIIISING